jgi:RsiW-degrading membrane proteinase PrsW (M82 family)
LKRIFDGRKSEQNSWQIAFFSNEAYPIKIAILFPFYKENPHNKPWNLVFWAFLIVKPQKSLMPLGLKILVEFDRIHYSRFSIH